MGSSKSSRILNSFIGKPKEKKQEMKDKAEENQGKYVFFKKVC